MELRQGQSLVMTPQLQQAIKLLQMSNFELQAFVDAELERNPLLERDEKTEIQKSGLAERTATVSDMVNELASGAAAEDRQGGTEDRVAPGPTDSGWSSFRPSGGMSLESDEHGFAATLTRAETLVEHLTDQLNLTVAAPADRLIGQHLIGMINETGYLTGELEGVAQTLGTTTNHVEAVLAILQDFDPIGVCARDLKECLSLQLKDIDRLDPAMAALIAHLELVAKRDYDGLRKICKVDLDDLHDMVAELRRLNPKPGNAFGSDPVQPVIPDVAVRAAPDGTWIVELNSDTLPRVLINNQYLATVSKSAARQQDAFLVLGVQHLRPINLKTVAEAIEMHESTVSRVTSNKYMATPRGTFEMKYFFTTAIASSESEGDAHSAESVRHRIREMIEAEGEAILSDDALVEKLHQAGIDIARRTVAKYRESLGIQSSVQRRRETRAMLRQSR